MMIDWNTLPIKCYIIKNENTGKEYHESNFEDAENKLLQYREDNIYSEFNLYALIDA